MHIPQLDQFVFRERTISCVFYHGSTNVLSIFRVLITFRQSTISSMTRMLTLLRCDPRNITARRDAS